jgi:hypothetical protein
MRSVTSLFLFLAFNLFATNILKAQADLPSRKNRIYVEILGNNFFDPNTYDDIEFISANYSRKITLNRYYMMFSLGFAPFKGTRYDSIKNTHYRATNLGFSAGVLTGRNIKHNGILLGVYFICATGEFRYTEYVSRPQHGGYTVFYQHHFSFQISPNVVYQFQSKSEKIFCRLTYSPKILASAFYKDPKRYGEDYMIYPFWGGISIGGGW